MKNKGFVLMETIVVIVVISVTLLTIFSSYNKILRKVKTENKYDTSEYIYMTEHIKKYMEDNVSGASVVDIYPCTIDSTTKKATSCSNLSTPTNYKGQISGIDSFNVKAIYLLTDINNFDKLIDLNLNEIKDAGEFKNSEYFDAYMINYIRKLDVGDTDDLIIVEYKRPALKTNGEPKKDSLGNPLYETYIASLEW